jgi:uncharacterized repeat protein (TIGR03803 family)
MKTITANRAALGICAATALLAACGALPLGQPAPSLSQRQGDTRPQVGAPGAIPQNGVRPASASYNVLYRFDNYPNGESPSGGLIDVNGTLYGTASGGGVKMCHSDRRGCGTVFSITPSGTETLLYSFNGASGNNPQAPLIGVKGTLYGTTYQGGAQARGTIYSLSTSGTETLLYSFRGRPDGGHPQAGLIDDKGTLYGTTSGGGPLRDGTVYSFTTTGLYSVLHGFLGKSDGSWPRGDLVAVKGKLYGTTLLGGGSSCNSYQGCGTIFSITPSGKEKVLYDFTGGSDGQSPNGDLVNVNGTLYGTTYRGGGSGCFFGGGCGTVYSVTTSGKLVVLYNFRGESDGGNPKSGLIDVNGTLYGTTFYGGSAACTYGCGTVYSITPSGVEKVLYAFAGGNDGEWPGAPLTSVHGTLYGETTAGGDSAKRKNCCGTIFALNPNR